MASKSLGTLTLDLIAKTSGFVAGMNKAERESAKWRKQVKKDIEDVSKKVATLGVAAAAGVAALTVQTVKAADEIQRLAAVSGASTTEFQKYAAGAKAFGVEQEKLADIFKDTSDKVGDFIQTGGGPLADFFENIAPQVGVTAEQFRKLSGPDALGLYVSSLEKAGLSQSDMTFYMEAIASDATLLLPLLRNNAEGFKAFGEQAEAAGAILSDRLLENTNRLNASLFLFEQSTLGAKNQIVEGLLPTLSDLSIVFLDISTSGETFTVVGEAVGGTIKFITSTAVGAVAAFDLLGKAIGGYAAVFEAAGVSPADFLNPVSSAVAAGKIIANFDKVKTAGNIVFSDLEATAQEYASTLDDIFSAGEDARGLDTKDERFNRLLEVYKQRQEMLAQISSGTISAPTKKESDEQGDINDRAERIRQSLLSEEDAIRESYERRKEIILSNTKITGEDRQRLLQKLAEERDEKLSQTSLKQLERSLLSEEERIMESYDRRKEMILKSTELTEKARQELIEKLTKKRDEELAGLEKDDPFKKIQENFVEGVQDGFSDILYDAFTGDLDDIEAAIGQMITRLAAEAAAAALTEKLFSSLPSGEGGGIVAGLGSLFNFGGASFEGGGYTGEGSRVGGLDGKGGKLAMLHPNETIIDHTRNDNSQSVTIGNISMPGVRDERTARKAAGVAAREMAREISRTQRYQ